ncbi:Myosin-17 [Chionoecetes opilio]|uniref:Myosin-17 n=1 Tax=Chionoecetes opilio TaxID=41210 RepID=A0A8J5D4A1_CHIOP|nr:Myosin-17 [Chionoecetes opilio]
MEMDRGFWRQSPHPLSWPEQSWRQQQRKTLIISAGWKGHKYWKQFRQLKKASIVFQKNIRTFLARNRYSKMKRASVVIQKHVRKFIVHQKYQRLRKATVIIQKYLRGWTARRKFETIRQQATARPYSSQSLISMNSLGYYSLTASTSSYSIHPSLVDASSSEASLGTIGALTLSGDIVNSYISPQHHQRLLETEESGIETDTESINGEDGVSRPRKLRRRAQLQELLQNRGRVHHVASEESLVDMPDMVTDSVEASPGAPYQNEPCLEHTKVQGSNVNMCNNPKPQGKRHSPDGRTRQDKPSSCVGRQKMRVATLRNLQDISSVLQTCSPSEDLQLVLVEQSLSMFFKSGVLSYRRMPRHKVPHARHLPALLPPPAPPPPATGSLGSSVLDLTPGKLHKVPHGATSLPYSHHLPRHHSHRVSGSSVLDLTPVKLESTPLLKNIDRLCSTNTSWRSSDGEQLPMIARHA